MLKRILLSLFFALIASVPFAAEDPLAPLHFLSGCWAMEAPGGVRVEENWTAPLGGVMLATGRTIDGGKVVFFEFLRIVKDDAGIAYIAQPAGGTAVRFPLTLQTRDQVVFENPAHDFPQRIEYRRSGKNRLTAIVSGKVKGVEQSEKSAYLRVRCPG